MNTSLLSRAKSSSPSLAPFPGCLGRLPMRLNVDPPSDSSPCTKVGAVAGDFVHSAARI